MTNFLALFMGFLISFAVLARGAHDLWAATIVYILILSVSSILIVHFCWNKRAKGLFLPPILPILGVFFVFSLSYRLSIHPRESYFELLDWGAAFLLFLISLQIYRSKKAVFRTIIFFVPVMVVQLIINVSEILPFLSSGSFPRVSGSLVNANMAAAFYLFWVPVFWHFLRTTPSKQVGWKRFWIVGLASTLLNILLAKSVSAVLCLVLMLPFFIGPEKVRVFKKKDPKLFWGVTKALVFLAGLLMVAKLAEIYGFGGYATEPGATSRLVWWKSGWFMFLANPWLGVGLGNFSSAYLAFKVGGGQHTLFAHSWVISLLAEVGFLGILALGIFVRTLFRFIPRKENPFLLGVVLFLLFGSFNIGLEYLSHLSLLFLFLGIVIAPELKKPIKVKPFVQIICVALGIAALPFLLSPFLASQLVQEAKLYQQKGNLSKAMEVYKDAANLDSRNDHAVRGWAAVSMERYKKLGNEFDLHNAIQLQRRAIRLNQLNGVYHWQLGNFLIEAGEKIKASIQFEKAIQLHKTNRLYRASQERLQKIIFDGKS